MTHLYQIHHLKVASTLALPELQTAPEGLPDILIEEGPVPSMLKASHKEGSFYGDDYQYQYRQGLLLLHVRDTGSFLIRENHILVRRCEGVSNGSIGLYLLGSALAFCLQMRGVFPFHGSAVFNENGVVLFVGESGAGKSTLARHLVQQGYRFLTDDVCVIDFDLDGQPLVYPSYPQAKLWEDAAQQLGVEVQGLSRVLPGLNKYRLPVHADFSTEPQPLRTIYNLVPGEVAQVESAAFNGIEKIRLLWSNLYRPMGLEVLDQVPASFAFCSRMGRAVPVHMLRRPTGGASLTSLQEEIERELKLSTFNN